MDTDKLIQRYRVGERNFKDVSLREADLQGVDLSGADLSGANLYGAEVTQEELYWAGGLGSDRVGRGRRADGSLAFSDEIDPGDLRALRDCVSREET